MYFVGLTKRIRPGLLFKQKELLFLNKWKKTQENKLCQDFFFLPKMFSLYIHCSPLITLCLRPIGMDCVLSESCYLVTTLQRDYRKMTILPFMD